LGFVQTSTTSALSASERVEQAVGSYQTDVKYPQTAPGATGFTRALPDGSQSINQERRLEAYFVVGGCSQPGIVPDHTQRTSDSITGSMMCVMPACEFLPV